MPLPVLNLFLAGAVLMTIGCGARTSLVEPEHSPVRDASPPHSDATAENRFDELAFPNPVEQCASQYLGGFRPGTGTECHYYGPRWGPQYLYLRVDPDGLAATFVVDTGEFFEADAGRERLPDGAVRWPPLELRVRRVSNDRFEVLRGQWARLYWPDSTNGQLYHDVHFLEGAVWIERGLLRFESLIRVDVNAAPSPVHQVQDCVRYIASPCDRPWMLNRDM